MEVFENLLSLREALVFAIALFSGVVHGYTGFGGAVLMVPLLSLIFPPIVAVSTMIITVFIGQLPLVWQARQITQWRECGIFLITAAITLPGGTYMLLVLDADIVRRIIGAATLIVATVLLAGWAYHGNRSVCVTGLFGCVCGLLQGTTGQAGPISVAYFITAPAAARLQRANIVITVMGLIILTIASMAVSGVMSSATLVLGLILGGPYLFGIWLGSRLFALLPSQVYRRAIVSLLFATGIIAIVW